MAKQVVRIFCLNSFWVGVSILVFPVFFPLLAIEKELSGTQTGLILCISPLSNLIMVPIVRRVILLLGLERCIFISGIAFAVAWMIIAFAAKIEETSTFFWVTVCSNFLVGFSNCNNVVGEQALLLRYSSKEDREKNLMMFRAAYGLGALIAPPLMSGFFAWGEYFACFMVVSIGFWLMAPIIYKRLYAAKNQWETFPPLPEINQGGREPTTWELLKHKNVAMAFGFGVVFQLSISFQASLMNPMLEDYYKLEPEVSSLFFTISAVCFVFGTPITFFLRSRKLASRRSIMCGALVLMAIANIIRTGDLRGNEIIAWVYVSQVLNGIGISLSTTACFPEIVDAVEQTPMYHEFNTDNVRIYISGVFVILAACAQFLGLFFGSFTAQYIGYTYSFVTCGCFLFVFAVAYIVVCGPGDIEDKDISMRNEQLGAEYTQLNDQVELVNEQKRRSLTPATKTPSNHS